MNRALVYFCAVFHKEVAFYSILPYNLPTANSPLSLHDTASLEICDTILKLVTLRNELAFAKHVVCRGLKMAYSSIERYWSEKHCSVRFK